MSAFEITGTANFSDIEAKLNNLQSSLNALKAPTLSPKVDVPNNVLGGLTSQLNREKGNFAKIGQDLGQSLTMGMTSQFGMAGNMAGSFAGALGGIGIAATAGALGLGALGAAAVSAAASWEDLKTSIGRTTGLQGDQLEDLMNQLQNLRQEMGITAEAAAGLVTSAGSIGVGQTKLAMGDMAGYKQEILDFAKATAMLQGAWGMSADETATGIGKMGSVTLNAWNMQRRAMGESEMSWADYAKSVGGKVDALANTMGSSEEEIVTAMKNASSAVATYAPSEETYGKWLALSSFLIDTGSSAGEAGTQIERMAKGAQQHGADLAAILGMDKESFNEALKTDFVGTFQDIAKELASMPESERPDMIKLLGIEGAGAMNKMIADYESGVNKLGTAIELKQSDISDGWDDVANNASKSFDRIWQAAQVSLEKIGGVVLPIITKIASGIATAWEKANEVGTNVYAGVQERITSADTAAIQSGSVIEWGKALLGIGEPAKEEISNAIEEGAKEGAQAAAPGVADGLTSGVSAAVAEAFTKANDEYIKSHSSGGYSLETMMQMSGQQSINYGRWAYKTTPIKSTDYAALENYSLQKYGRKSDVGGVLQVVDASGNVVQSMAYSSEAEYRKLTKDLEDAIKPAILDVPKYMSSVGDETGGELARILEDGVVEFTEKNTLKEYIASLDELEMEHPIEFRAAGLENIRQEMQDAVDGIPAVVKVKLDTGEMETNFAVWLSENAPAYETMKKVGGITSYESAEREYFDVRQKATDRELELLDIIDKAATSGNYEDIEVLPETISELGALNPALLGLTAVQNRLTTAELAYASQVKKVGDQFVVLDENGNVLANAHLRTSVAAEILSGGLTQAASSISSLADAASRAAVVLNNYRAPGYSMSAVMPSYLPQTNATPAYNYKTSTGGAIIPSWFTSGISNVEYAANWHEFTGKMNVPKLAVGGKVVSEGLAWVGEKGTEYIIPESEIKGLYPESAKVDKGSMQYLTGAKFFEDYPYTITGPSGYQWSKWPNAPQVNVSGDVPRAWLSEGQPTGMDAISSEIRAIQLNAIKTGAGSVVPYWLRGEQEQPAWWVEAATKLSPKYAENWAATKGGNMPQIVSDAQDATISEDMALISDPRSDACIAFVKPSGSLRTSDAFYLARGAADIDTDRALLYDERTDSCIPFLTAPYLKTNDPFYLETGSMSLGGKSEATVKLSQIEKNTADIKTATIQYSSMLGGTLDNGGIFSQLSGFTSGSTGAGALVTGLSEDGYVVTYDPRTDTCEGLAFNPPDPSLKTTDKFYLGITAGNLPIESYEEGYGWGGRVAWTDDPSLRAEQSTRLAELQKSSQKTEDNTKQIADNTGKIATDISTATSVGALVAGGGGGYGSSIIGLANRGGGWYWGGTSISGGGAWVGGGASASGWGAQASSGASGGFGGSHGWGSVQWAEGGFADRPTFGIFGEAGTEAFVPISDRAAGLRILPAVLRGLGVPTFSKGGIVGSIRAAMGPLVGSITVINHANQPVNERKLAKEIGAQIESKFFKDHKR